MTPENSAFRKIEANRIGTNLKQMAAKGRGGLTSNNKRNYHFNSVAPTQPTTNAGNTMTKLMDTLTKMETKVDSMNLSV